MPMQPPITLLADLGGTNARFALFDGTAIGPIARLPVADYADLRTAIATFLHTQQPPRAPVRAVLAIAGPVANGRATFTNAAWVADTAELTAQFRFERVDLINDFAAQAWALPHLQPADLHRLGAGKALPGAPMAVLGPGTGLGVAAFVPTRGGGFAISTEGGHVTLPSTSAREDALIAHLRGERGHVSAEGVLSGRGMMNLHAALVALDGGAHAPGSASEITAAGLDGSCPVCRETLLVFGAMLGTVAGDLALTFGARGGVFIAGGIAPRIASLLARSAFRTNFEAKGRFRDYLAEIPTAIVLHSDPAFVGLSALARES